MEHASAHSEAPKEDTLARDQFLDSLSAASRLLNPPTFSSDHGSGAQNDLAAKLESADLWLTPKSVDAFDPTDFGDWPREDQAELSKEVAAFLAIAEQVGASAPATKAQSRQAHKHLQRVFDIVRDRLLPEWLDAQEGLVRQATDAARANGWYVERDEKEVRESLLGSYKAPRLRIRTKDREVVLDPIARFGSGRRGIVDLVVMPTYETAYLIAFKDGKWNIVAPRGSLNARPFSQATLVNTITRLPHN